MLKWWSLEKDHGDDGVEHKMIKGSTWKRRKKNRNELKTKVYVIGPFLFCTQDTIEGVSDLGSMPYYEEGNFTVKTVIKCH
jgi:hypothetical protein